MKATWRQVLRAFAAAGDPATVQLSVQDLEWVLGRAQTTTYDRLRAMQEKGLVARRIVHSGRAGRPRWLFFLTDAGRAALAALPVATP